MHFCLLGIFGRSILVLGVIWGYAFSRVVNLHEVSFGLPNSGESPFLGAPFLSCVSSGVTHSAKMAICVRCRLACPKTPNRGNRPCLILVLCFIWGGQIWSLTISARSNLVLCVIWGYAFWSLTILHEAANEATTPSRPNLYQLPIDEAHALT